VGLNEHRKLIELSDLVISHLYLSLPLHAAFADRHADIAQLLNRRLGAVRAKLSEDVFKFQLSPQHQFEVTLVMACHIPAQSKLAKWLLKIYQRTFDQLHYNLELRIMSRQRALQELRAGRIDLDCARTRNFADIVGKSARMVPAQVGETALSVYSQTPGDRINDLQLLNSDDRLTHVRGSVFVEGLIKHHGLKSHPTLNARASLKMLISNRADYYFGFIDDTELAINRALLQDHIHNRGTLLSIPVYMYIHARHQQLIPEIAEVFSKLNSQGPWLRPEATPQSL
ncbi:MAG: hypothetical protein VXZ35_05430, partial [Pseudomonadota bacterium]|nr:hypothetical protein [Pseudomonadota bacterium]